MSKIDLDTISSGYQSTVNLNDNFQSIEDELNNKVLYRDNPDGEPNQMLNDLDMDSNRIINLPSAASNNEPATYGQLVAAASSITSISTLSEEQTASSDGQSVFNLTTITYTPGAKNLVVYRNGVKIPRSSYTETDTSTITLSATNATSVKSGDEFEFEVNQRDVDADTYLASNVTYTPAGSGAATTDVQTKLRERVSVKDFGAVGDGVTDDTAAIQAALTYITSTEGELYVPKGDYVISSSLNIYGNISVIGEGPQVSVFKPTAAVAEPIQIGNVVNPNDAHRGVLRGFTVDRGTYDGTSDNGGFVFYWCFGSSFYDLESREYKYNFWFKPGDGQGVAYISKYNMNGVGGLRNVYWDPDTGAPTPGYANEITFYGGRMFTRAVTESNVHWNGGTGGRFINVSCEGAGDQAIYLGGDGNFVEQCRTEGTWVNDDIVIDAGAVRNIIFNHDFYATITDNGSGTTYLTHNDGNQFAQVAGGVANPTMAVDHTSGGADTALLVTKNRWGATDYGLRVHETATNNDAFYASTQGQVFTRRTYISDESGHIIPPLHMGDYRLWWDSQDRLLTKDSAPASATDGTSVGLGGTQTTVGAAGAASALPANPTGYVKVLIGGTEYAMPYYAVS